MTTDIADNIKRLTALAALIVATAMVLVPQAHAAAGDLDPSFGAGGTQVFPAADDPRTVLAQGDGKVVIADGTKFTLTRVNTAGALDRTFAGDGIASATFDGKGGIAAAALQPDGKIVATGLIESGTSFKIGVARFNTNGSLDPTFDPGGADGAGKKLYNPAGPWYADGLVIEGDGDIVMAGASPAGWTITRLSPTGVEEIPPSQEYAFSSNAGVADATLGPDGTIVVAGYRIADQSSERDIAVARFKPDGSLDKTFAGTGSAVTGPGNGDDYAVQVVAQPDGKVLAAGTNEGGDQSMVVTRFGLDGKLDKGFGAEGTAAVDLPGADTGVGTALQPDGKIVVAGMTAPDYDFAAGRLDASGQPDPTFGDGGQTTVQFSSFALAGAAAVDSQGRLVIAGREVKVDGGVAISRLAVARLLADPVPGEPTGPTGPGDSGTTDPGTTADPGTQANQPPPKPRCAGKEATIIGSPGKDKIRGTRRNDVIVALGGNDVISGLNGNDVICAGAGNDVLSGGRGRDTLRGEAGKDKLVGGPGRDRLVGGAGRDATKQ